MSGGLTTHVLDTSAGCPASGVAIELWALSEDGQRQLLARAVTNERGRTDKPLIGDLQPGTYELVFDVGRYFGADEAGFLELVPVRFRVIEADTQYHVPLLVSPWSYTTYRGS